MAKKKKKINAMRKKTLANRQSRSLLAYKLAGG